MLIELLRRMTFKDELRIDEVKNDVSRHFSQVHSYALIISTEQRDERYDD